MIEIQNERGQYLQLYPDSNLETEFNSWLLSEDDTLPGSYTQPFRFPIEGNESFIAHKHRPEAGAFVGIPVTIWDDGLPYGAASLSFRVNDDAADGILSFDAGSIAAKLRSKYLHDVVMDQTWTLCRDPAELPAVMLKTTDAASNPYPFVFFPVHNEKFTDPDYEEKNVLYTYQHISVVNSYSSLLSTFLVDTPQGIGYPVVPFLYFKWLLEKVCAYLGYTPEGNWLQNEGIRSLVLYNEVAINSTESFFKPSIISAKYHVWNMTLGSFFRYLRDDMGVGVFFDNFSQRIYFYPYVELAANPTVVDLSDSLLKGYNADPVNYTGLSINFPKDNTDDYTKEQSTTEAYLIGEGETSVDLTIGTLPMMATAGSFLTQKVLLPVTKHQGTSLDERYKNMGIYSLEFPPRNAPAPKLLMYLGMQPGFGGQLYPYGSSININCSQQKVGAFSLLPNVPESLFHQFVRPYYEYKSFSKRITYNFFMKLTQAMRLKMWQSLQIGSADLTSLTYLIQRFNYRLPDIDGRVMAQLTVWPLLPPPENYTPKIQTTMIWVRLGLSVFSGGFYPENVGAFTVTFDLFAFVDASLVATSVREFPIFFSYTTRGYNSTTNALIEETITDSVMCPAYAKSVSLPVPAEFWNSDDPIYQYQNANVYYIQRSSFKVLYSPNYLIIP